MTGYCGMRVRNRSDAGAFGMRTPWRLTESCGRPSSPAAVSEVEADREACAVTDCLKGTMSEEQQCRAIQHYMLFVNRESSLCSKCRLPAICESLVALMGDDRPLLTKSASMFIKSVARRINVGFMDCADNIIPKLFQCVESSNFLVVALCKEVLCAVAEYCKDASIVKLILAEASARVSVRRVTVYETLSHVLDAWPNDLIRLVNSDIVKRAKAAVNDSDAAVSEAAAAVIIIVDNKGFDRVSGSVVDIALLMPPETKEHADEFCDLLVDIVKRGSFGSFRDVEFAIPDSLIRASSLSKRFDSVVRVIPQLIDKYKREFVGSITRIIASSSNDVAVMRKAVEKYNVDEMIRRFTEDHEVSQAVVVKFFVFLVNSRFVQAFDAKTARFLRNFVCDNGTGDDQIVLRRVLGMGAGHGQRIGKPPKIPEGRMEKSRGQTIIELLSDPVKADNGLNLILDELEDRESSYFRNMLVPYLLRMWGKDDDRAAKSHRCLGLIVKSPDDIVNHVLTPECEETAICYLSFFMRSWKGTYDMTNIVDIVIRNMDNVKLSVRRHAMSLIARVTKEDDSVIGRKWHVLTPEQQKVLEIVVMKQKS